MAAIPLTVIIEQFGPNASSDLLRAALRCTVCGRRGCLQQHPSWGMADGYRSTPPLDRVPPALRAKMAEIALRPIGVVLPRPSKLHESKRGDRK